MVGASTRIENAVLTDPEIDWIDTVLTKDGHPSAFAKNLDLIENKLSKDRERSIEEVVGCRDLLLLVYEQSGDFFPLTESVLRGFHHELLKYYPGASHHLGRYKTVTNSVVERNAKTGEERAVFQTADPGPLTETAMSDLVSWYNQALPTNPWGVAVACELVFRFLAIHPFQDGNGRLGRALFLLALLQSPDKDVSQVARYIAIDRQIERHKREYYAALQRSSSGKYHQDPTEYRYEYFLNYMIKVLKLALDDIAVYRKTYAAIQSLSPAAKAVLEGLKGYPEKRLSTKDLLELTRLPRRTVVYSLGTLIKFGLIQRYGQGAGVRYQIVF